MISSFRFQSIHQLVSYFINPSISRSDYDSTFFTTCGISRSYLSHPTHSSRSQAAELPILGRSRQRTQVSLLHAMSTHWRHATYAGDPPWRLLPTEDRGCIAVATRRFAPGEVVSIEIALLLRHEDLCRYALRSPCSMFRVITRHK